MPLYKGNVYVVDEIMGRMYLSKGEHLMRIAETASHWPFQDHELSISHHIPEREYSRQGSQPIKEEVETIPRGEEEGVTNPITPIVGTAGGVGSTSILVAESKCQPGEEAFTPCEVPVGERLKQEGIPSGSSQDQVGASGKYQSDQGRGEPEWALPEPSELRGPLGGGVPKREPPPQADGTEGGEARKQKALSPELRIVETDKRQQRRLAALARDHIVKLREERLKLAQEWLEEYSMHTSSAKLWGMGLGTLRVEYIHWHNRLLDREKQPHSDFFINLSPQVEDKLDFEEDEPFDLADYDQYFEWDKAEYMRLWFIAARHYAFQRHWDDAYAYVVRSCPDNIPQHQETYKCHSCR